MLDVTIDTTQQVQVTLRPVDASGNAVVLTSKPKWELTAGNATFKVADDGLSALLISPSVQDDSLFTITDTTPGSPLTDTIELHTDVAVVVPPPPDFAVSFGLTKGAVTPKGTVV